MSMSRKSGARPVRSDHEERVVVLGHPSTSQFRRALLSGGHGPGNRPRSRSAVSCGYCTVMILGGLGGLKPACGVQPIGRVETTKLSR